MKIFPALLSVWLICLSLYGQYTGTPWNGIPWQFGKDNSINLSEGSRIPCWKYDIGEAEQNIPTASSNNLNAVIGMNAGVLRTNFGPENPETAKVRLDSAIANSISLHASDIALMDMYSNFQWHTIDDRWRDGGQWTRYTLNFDEGTYLFVNRGYPNTNGNFNLFLRIYTTDMQLLSTVEHNNLGHLGAGVTDLGYDPDGFFDLLPETPTSATKWYLWEEAYDLNGTYIIEIHTLRAGALGGAIGEFTFVEAVPVKPTINNVVAGTIDGCEGTATISVTAAPEIAGNELEYQYRFKGHIYGEEWSSSHTIEVTKSGVWQVFVREAGYILTDQASLTVERTGCMSTPYGDSPIALPGRLELEEFDLGGEGTAYYEVSSPFNNSGTWIDRNEEENGLMGVDLDQHGAIPVCLTDMGTSLGGVNGEWTMYSAVINQAGDYHLALRYNAENVNTSKLVKLDVFTDQTEPFDTYTFAVNGNWDWYGGAENTPELTFEEKWYDTTYTQIMSLPAGEMKIRFYANTGSMKLDYLEFIKTEDLIPEVRVAEQVVQQGIPFRVAGNKDGGIYLVPVGTDPGDDLDELKLVMVTVTANDTVDLPTGNVPSGNYLLYARDKAGLVSAGVQVEVETLTLPVLTVENDSVMSGSPFLVTFEDNGTVYLVPAGTSADMIAFYALKVVTVAAGIPAELSTMGLPSGSYLLYAIASGGTVSGPVDVTVWEEEEEPSLVKTAIPEIIKVYPTVFNNRICFEPGLQNCRISLYNAGGLLLKSADNFSGQVLEAVELQPGLYILQISSHNRSAHYILIKQ
jgi:hypothetical protein